MIAIERAGFALAVLARHVEPTTGSLPLRPASSGAVCRGAVVVCGVNKLDVLNLEHFVGSVGIDMVNLYPVAAPTTERKEAARLAKESIKRAGNTPGSLNRNHPVFSARTSVTSGI